MQTSHNHICAGRTVRHLTSVNHIFFAVCLAVLMSPAAFAQVTTIAGLPGDHKVATTGNTVNDIKTGSVLFYNHYISDSLSSTIDTRVSITNTHPTSSVTVHVFMIDSITCTTADFFVCLTRNQTVTFLVSDLDPDTSGYLLAVAVDSLGRPTSFNYLAGEQYVVAPTGHRFGLSAVAAARLDGSSFSSPINSDGVTSTLFFNGSQYDYLPQSVMLDSFPSQTSAPGLSIGDTRLYLYSPLNNLVTAGSRFSGNVFFLIFDDEENGFSGQLPLSCYLASDKQRISSVRTVPNLGSVVPAGRTGWARFYSIGSLTITSNVTGGQKTLDGVPLLGATATRVAAFNGGHNLRYLTTFVQGFSITIPVISPPECDATGYVPTGNGSSI